MKGGRTPIHIQRWCPADYQADEHVRLLYARRDWRTLTFYRTFLDVAFMQGGDLPAEPAALAAVLGMPLADVRKALGFCLNRLIHNEDGRLFQGRVKRDVQAELEFRETQRARANMRWHPDQDAVAFPPQSHRNAGRQSPPSPAPAPAPSPSTEPPFPPASGGDDGHDHGAGTNGRRLGPRAVRVQQASRIVQVWERLAAPWHLDIPLDARERITRSLREGTPPWQVLGTISEMVRSELVASFSIEPDASWPPQGWLEGMTDDDRGPLGEEPQPAQSGTLEKAGG